MATEKRLIDAYAMREDWLTNGENEYVYDTNAILNSIDAQPTVDAVEVVRCKDCTNKRKAVAENGQIIFCSIWGRGWCRVDPNDFCSYGGRRTDG